MLGGDDLTERSVGGFDGDFGGGNFDGGGNRGGRQREIEFACFVNLQPQVLGVGRLEAREFDVQSVDADRQQRNQVMAGVVGDPVARETGALRSGSDFGPGDVCSGFIDDGSGKAAVGLGVRRWGKDQKAKTR